MKIKKFIREINLIYDTLFIILLALSLLGTNIYCYFLKNNMLFFNFKNSIITIFCITSVFAFIIYFMIYIFRLIYNKIIIWKLCNNTKDSIENNFGKIKFKKDKIIITDSYLIVGAYLLKIIKLEEINSIFITYPEKAYIYEMDKNLDIVCKNNRRYIIDGYYVEEIFENIKKYICIKNPSVSFKPTEQYKKVIKKQSNIYIVCMLIALILVLVLIKL